MVAAPNGIRFAMLLGFASLATLGYSIISGIYTIYFSSSVWIAISAALFTLSITAGVRAFMDERTASNSEWGKQHVSSQN
jgi:hypothetical protein